MRIDAVTDTRRRELDTIHRIEGPWPNSIHMKVKRKPL
jgi:hypothetical protein